MATYTALCTLQNREQAEALGEAMEILDPAPTGVGVFEIEDGSGTWEVGGYFVEKPDIAGLALLSTMHGAGDFAVSRVDDRDWVAQVRRELHPVAAGRFTVYGAHDSHRIGVHRIGLRIEAAMAFGTGHHGTTRGCLVLFDRLLKRGFRPMRAADVGCGTGVLAMAAARAVRARCVATDLDPVAVATARENMRANQAGALVQVGQAAGLRSDLHRAAAPYDLVFANILAAPLKRMAPQIAHHLAPGGFAILSGLLTAQTTGVEAWYRGHGLIAVDRVTLGEWTSLLMRRIEKYRC
ncbi:MAG: 50S ribosomal protein L11 methyltransferase [Pseudomonadota bacterium]